MCPLLCAVFPAHDISGRHALGLLSMQALWTRLWCTGDGSRCLIIERDRVVDETFTKSKSLAAESKLVCTCHKGRGGIDCCHPPRHVPPAASLVAGSMGLQNLHIFR